MHLTIDEIIEFVSFSRISDETLSLSAKVNEHIRECGECAQRVMAFQAVYDELSSVCGASCAKESLYRVISEQELKDMQAQEIRQAIEPLEDVELKSLIG